MLAELEPFVQPSLAVLLALVVLLLLTGRLVPIRTLTRELEQERRARDAAEARADRLADYVAKLLPVADVTGELIGEMRRRGLPDSPSDDGTTS